MADGTDVMVAGRLAQEDCFGALLESDPPKPERLRDLVEGWMIYGTDHWFVTPSFWNSLQQLLQERIVPECWEGPPHNNFKLDYELFRAGSLPQAVAEPGT